ncbi:MAG: RluA family pseudouridine synthase [Saprospiraceae bacterium]
MGIKELENLSIIYEDNHLIGVSKPAGLLVHGDITGDMTLEQKVKAYIKVRYNKPGDVFLGVIHRIDRPVSGVVIFARTSKALTRMNALIANKKIKKTYLAIVNHRPEELEGTLTHYILKDETKNIVKAFSSAKKGGKEATLDYKLIGELEGKCLLEVIPHSGRPHQIRAQLNKLGCHIIGDVKYGAESGLPDQSIGLHCYSMQFDHPVTGTEVCIKSSPPKRFPWSIFGIE